MGIERNNEKLKLKNLSHDTPPIHWVIQFTNNSTIICDPV